MAKKTSLTPTELNAFIQKHAKIHYKDLKDKYGTFVDYNDIWSYLQWIAFKAAPKFEGKNNASITTYLKKCFENRMKNYARDVLKKQNENIKFARWLMAQMKAPREELTQN